MISRKINISESERNNILGQYYHTEPSFFDNYLTVDGRFYIKNDELFDLHEQKELGNIFSIKNLKILFENVKIKNNSYIENVKKSLNETSNEKFTIFEIKREILLKKSLLTEQEDNVEPQTTQNDSTGSIIGKGVLYIARKIKSLLWSIGGMAVDAFLIASGIGKSVQWIPWAIVLALDVYEWTTGDYGTDEDFKNSSTFWKILTVGFDIMGMMTSGPFAKAAQKLFNPVRAMKNEVEIAKFVEKTPQAKGVLSKLSTLLNGASQWLTKGAETVSTKMPTLGKWLSSTASTVGKAVGSVGSFIGKILGAPGKIAGKIGSAIGGEAIGKGLQSATNTAALMGGFEQASKAIDKFKTPSTMDRVNKEIERQLNLAF